MIANGLAGGDKIGGRGCQHEILHQRRQAYAEMGTRVAKWRAVFSVDNAERPSLACIDAKAHTLARYAALSQEAGLTLVVEPEEGAAPSPRCDCTTVPGDSAAQKAC